MRNAFKILSQSRWEVSQQRLKNVHRGRHKNSLGFLPDLFTKNKPSWQHGAENMFKIMEKRNDISSNDWFDMYFGFHPHHDNKIAVMSVKPGVPLYKGKIENYINKRIDDVFEGPLGAAIKGFGIMSFKKNMPITRSFEIPKGRKIFWKELTFCPIRIRVGNFVIVCAKHLPVKDNVTSFCDPIFDQ